MGGGGILHQCSCIGRSSVVAIAGKEVGKGGELLVQVLTQGVEFALDGSGGRLCWVVVALQGSLEDPRCG